MVKCISNTSYLIGDCVKDFWEGVNTIDPDKLLIDGDNMLMLYVYVVLRARIPNMFAYIKVIEEFGLTPGC